MSSNFAGTTVATAPSPATSGTTLTVATGTGTRLYAGQATLYPAGTTPTPTTAEIVTITDVTGDVVTIIRAREGSTARTVAVGDAIVQGVTAAMWDDLYAFAHTAVSVDVGNALVAGTDGHPYLAASAVPADLAYVRFATTGSTFAPVVELAPGSTATVTWTVEGTGLTATGLTPTIAWGVALTRHVRMTAADVDGSDALGDIIMINLGYAHGDDAGRYVMGEAYDKAAELVTGVEYLHLCTGLIRFAAANITGLVGELSFRGLSALQYVECAYSRVQAVDVTGCTSLIRLCLEQNNLTYLDINPVAACLYDLRAAAQQGAALTLATLTANMAHLYHFCVRDQTVTGMPAGSRLPVVEELYVWNTGQVGTLTVTSSVASSILAYTNGYTSAVVTDCAAMGFLDLHGNALTESAVDAILVEAASWGTSSRAVDLSGGTNAAPSSTGTAAAATLTGRSWTVTLTDGGSSSLWEDLFERADATGLAQVGNGWATPGVGDANIVSGDLVRSDSAGYQVVVNPTDVTLPADYVVTATLPGTSIGAYLGIVGRWAGGNGVAAFFDTAAAAFSDLRLCEAAGYLQNQVTLTADDVFPASWSNSGIDHTIALRMVGTTCSIVLDGVTVGHGTLATNNATGTGVGMCGEGSARHLRSIAVTAV